MIKYDVIVVGSGPIGLSAALMLAAKGIKTAILLDHKKLQYSTRTDYRLPARLFAVSHGSILALTKICVETEIAQHSQSINHIRVVDDNSYSKVDFSPYDIGLENFGRMIDESDLIRILYSKLRESAVNIYESNSDLNLISKDFSAEVHYSGGSLQAHIIIAADGKQSGLRKSMGIDVREKSYNQTAIVVDIEHSDWLHDGIAVEKFTANGPFAILPKHNNNGTISSLVWVERGQINDLTWCDDDLLHDMILRKLDGYLGEIKVVSQPLTYHLKLSQSERRYRNRVVFVGDAAQAIHPIAGQGFNLGLRDVTTLLDLVTDAIDLGLDPGANDFLEKYSQSRDLDVRKMMTSTTLLNSLFSNDILPLKLARRLGLRLFDKLDFLKKAAMHYAAGTTESFF